MSEVIELERAIGLHDKLYWDDNNPKITDQEYDNLVKKLQILNPESSDDFKALMVISISPR